ncbi:hypothetical protein DFH29DRAFT_1000447 [Suillus ampliporus]|nr:hypothetical protein DFH29DRAFT_1000447 [Suillus ampliporus]
MPHHFNSGQQNSHPYEHVEAPHAEQLQGSAHYGQPNPQLPQIYLPPLPVDSYEDPTPGITQHQVMTRNDQALAPADLLLLQNFISTLSPSDALALFVLLERIVGHDNYSAAIHSSGISGSNLDEPLHDVHASHSPDRCLWMTGDAVCGMAADVNAISEHVALFHLDRVPSDSQVPCLFRGCLKTVRRDTILRHIRSVHFGMHCHS